MRQVRLSRANTGVEPVLMKIFMFQLSWTFAFLLISSNRALECYLPGLLFGIVLHIASKASPSLTCLYSCPYSGLPYSGFSQSVEHTQENFSPWVLAMIFNNISHFGRELFFLLPILFHSSVIFTYKQARIPREVK